MQLFPTKRVFSSRDVRFSEDLISKSSPTVSDHPLPSSAIINQDILYSEPDTSTKPSSPPKHDQLYRVNA